MLLVVDYFVRAFRSKIRKYEGEEHYGHRIGSREKESERKGIEWIVLLRLLHRGL